ncbi:MAG TPA: hypothetical protein VEZ90_13775 [Blastocatellia bacterium]|nr:hypothetical protein [Blastocatellia bacterium]
MFHIVVSIAPNLLISNGLGAEGLQFALCEQSSREPKVLDWHTGYGVVSFGTGDLPWVKTCVDNQKEHHSTGKVYRRLESTEPDDGLGDINSDDENDEPVETG